MTSAIVTTGIDATKPASLSATTQSVRANFAAIVTQLDTAGSEITALQNGKQDAISLSAGVLYGRTTASSGAPHAITTGTGLSMSDSDLFVDLRAGTMLSLSASEEFHVTLPTANRLLGSGASAGKAIELSYSGRLSRSASDLYIAMTTGSRLLGGAAGGAGPAVELTVSGNLSISASDIYITLAAANRLLGSGAAAGAAIEISYSGNLSLSSSDLYIAVSAASRILGRGAGSAGPVQELTLGSGLTISGTDLFVSAATAASQAEMEAASSTAVFASPGTTQYHPGVAKACVTFTGSATVSVNESYNVSSVTDGGTGTYSVNFSTPFSTNRYTGIGMAQNLSVGDNVVESNTSLATTSVFTIFTIRTDTGVPTDNTRVYMAFFGDQ